jgi:hypothetical protein
VDIGYDKFFLLIIKLMLLDYQKTMYVDKRDKYFHLSIFFEKVCAGIFVFVLDNRNRHANVLLLPSLPDNTIK